MNGPAPQAGSAAKLNQPTRRQAKNLKNFELFGLTYSIIIEIEIKGVSANNLKNFDIINILPEKGDANKKKIFIWCVAASSKKHRQVYRWQGAEEMPCEIRRLET